MTLVRLVARPMLAATFITGGIHALKNVEPLAAKARPVTDRLGPTVERATEALPFEVTPAMMIRANAVLHIVVGSMLATGRAPRLASMVLATSMLPTTLGGHRYWEESDPNARTNQRLHFYKNISTMGGLLLAAVDTEGRPSLAWRAKRTAHQAKEGVTGLTSR